MLFRKLRFRRFVRTKQSEETLLNEIENKFLSKEDKLNGKKLMILMGDYSRTSQMKGTLPNPNIGFKKLLLWQISWKPSPENCMCSKMNVNKIISLT
jgi:hypothetical protein